MVGVMDADNWQQELYFFVSCIHIDQSNRRRMSHNFSFLVDALHVADLSKVNMQREVNPHHICTGTHACTQIASFHL